MAEKTFRIEIESTYDLHNQLPAHLSMAKEQNLDVDISRVLEGGIYGFPEFDEYYTSRQIDFFSAIYQCCDRAGYDPSRITLWWGNANIKELYDNWCNKNCPKQQFKAVCYFPVWMYLLATNVDENSKYITYNENEKRKNLFTFFVGFNREHRIKAMNFLYDNNLLDKCDWTWVNSDTDGLPIELHHQIPKSAESHKHFDAACITTNPGEEFFNLYKDNYFDLITETFYNHDFMHYESYKSWFPVFFSEKIFRSILNKRPFLLIGNRNSLKELHRLGFKTFPDMFDESYDSLDDDQRIHHVLNQLPSLTVNYVHNKVYSESVSDAVEHNYNRMWEIMCSDDIVTTRFKKLWHSGTNFSSVII